MSTSPQQDPYRIITEQQQVHPRLPEVLARHHRQPYQAPISDTQRAMFERLWPLLRQPIILDLGCGTGMSTRYLAGQYPQALVVGIDQSITRLQRCVDFRQQAKQGLYQQDNTLLIHADAVPLLQLMAQQKMRVLKIYFLYPNPWPKAKHLQRRWHGHPVFECCMQLCREVELRTNWLIYAKEFQLALDFYNCQSVFESLSVTQPITLFERKYHQHQSSLYRVLSLT
jgi:tRNA (guanine-N7-)-methyltransferase